MDFANKIGISRQHASRIESGERIPSLDLLIKISSVFNISIDELLGKQISTETEKELFSLLTNCSQKEAIILIENMRDLKEILDKYSLN